MNPGGWAPSCRLLTPPHLPPHRSHFQGEGGGKGCVHIGAACLGLRPHARCRDRKEGRTAGLEKRRSRSSSHSALPRDEQGAQGEPGDTRAGQWQSSPALGHHQTGPHPGSKCQAGQLKQADKGRTIPDLKNAWKYLPEGLALSPSGRGSAEELGLITPWAAFCCAEASGGQSCQALGEGQGGWSLARTCGCTCLPDRLA